MGLRFSFDRAKDAANRRKHGISLADAEAVYYSADKITLDSVRGDERRQVAIAGVGLPAVVLVLVYVERDDEIRVISLRRASRQERRHYANAKEN